MDAAEGGGGTDPDGVDVDLLQGGGGGTLDGEAEDDCGAFTRCGIT